MNKAQQIIEEQKQKLNIADAPKDEKCPFTGSLKVRGRMFRGTIISKDTHRTVRVTWTTSRRIKKYERVMYRRTKVAAHNPDIINADVGDEVYIAECRPLSKTKKFVVIQNLGHSRDFTIKQETIEQDKQFLEAKGARGKDVASTSSVKETENTVAKENTSKKTKESPNKESSESEPSKKTTSTESESPSDASEKRGKTE